MPSSRPDASKHRGIVRKSLALDTTHPVCHLRDCDEAFDLCFLCCGFSALKGILKGSGEEKARGIVAAELKRIGWTAEDLRSRRKGDAKKVLIAHWLRAETTMMLKWIAGELQMGAWTHVPNLQSKE